MKEWIAIIIVLLFIIIVRTKVRGYFWLDRVGNKLTFKQFMSRWKSGVEGVTPLQQTKTTLWSYPLVLGGVLVGIIIMFIKRQWWLFAILLGSLPMTLMSLLSTYQKYLKLKKVNEIMKELNKQEVKNE